LLEPTDRFSERIEGSINHYLRSKPEETFRAAHDALRALWKRCRLDSQTAGSLGLGIRNPVEHCR